MDLLITHYQFSTNSREKQAQQLRRKSTFKTQLNPRNPLRDPKIPFVFPSSFFFFPLTPLLLFAYRCTSRHFIVTPLTQAPNCLILISLPQLSPRKMDKKSARKKRLFDEKERKKYRENLKFNNISRDGGERKTGDYRILALLASSAIINAVEMHPAARVVPSLSPRIIISRENRPSFHHPSSRKKGEGGGGGRERGAAGRAALFHFREGRKVKVERIWRRKGEGKEEGWREERGREMYRV